MEYLNAIGAPTIIIIIVSVLMLTSSIIISVSTVKKEAGKEFNFIIGKIKHKKETTKMIFDDHKMIEEIIDKQNSDRNIFKAADKDIKEDITRLENTVNDVVQTLIDIRIENMRNTILDFASECTVPSRRFSREKFKNVMKLYTTYEKYVEDNGRTNDEVNISYDIICKQYEKCVKEHLFLEDSLDYPNKE